jgi:hypothetical protein
MPSGGDQEEENENETAAEIIKDNVVGEDSFHDTIEDEFSVKPPSIQQDDSTVMNISTIPGDESFRASTVRSGATITSTRTHMTASASNQHLLRLKSFWVPGTCSVCSKVMVGKNSGFRCEVCSLDCCKDCRLNVDIELPCGSVEAAKVVQGAIQNKLSAGNIMSIIAPDESFQAKEVDKQNGKEKPVELSSSHDHHLSTIESASDHAIGCFKINFVQACVFQTPMAPDSDPLEVFERSNRRDFRIGDYYVRITRNTGSKDERRTARTRTIQNTATPKFSAGEMRFNV